MSGCLAASVGSIIGCIIPRNVQQVACAVVHYAVETKGDRLAECFIIIEWRRQGWEASGQISGCHAAKGEPARR